MSWNILLFSVIFLSYLLIDESYKLIFPISRWSSSIFKRFSVVTYCPDPSLPRLEGSLKTTCNRNLPPLIHFIDVENDYSSTISMIEHETNLSAPTIEELMDFGSVYTKSPILPIYERIYQDCPVSSGSKCRIHVNPSRYPFPYETFPWKKRIFTFNQGRYLVINKPAGIPVVPTLDNRKENLVFHMNRIFNEYKKEISRKDQKEEEDNPNNLLSWRITSRLDTCTSGLLIMANDTKYAGKIFKNQNNIRKFYKALTPVPLPLGIIQHLFRTYHPNRHHCAKPTLLRNINDGLSKPIVNNSHWTKVEIVVHQSKLKKLSAINSTYLEQWNYTNYLPANAKYIYENEIELKTGKTHQIRLQLAALNISILGDSRYHRAKGYVYEGDDTEWKDGVGLFGRDSLR